MGRGLRQAVTPRQSSVHQQSTVVKLYLQQSCRAEAAAVCTFQRQRFAWQLSPMSSQDCLQAAAREDSLRDHI